jgi:hypothetical protein
MSLIQTIKNSVPAKLKPLGYLRALVEKKTNGSVRAGPFKGQIIAFGGTQYSMYVPKVIGLYERELHSIIDEICKLEPTTVINIGAGDGYYSVGLSQRLRAVRVTAFEAEAIARDNLVRNASVNGVSSQIDVRGACDPVELTNVLRSEIRPLIICDAEGQEKILLDPLAIPALRTADILVETHDFIEPGVTMVLQDRFAPSHEVCLIYSQPRLASDFPWQTMATTLMPRRYLELVVSECRPEIMSWLWMKCNRNEFHVAR